MCAARWALSLGCGPVYLVGMGARGDGDFYGPNKWHGPETLGLMRSELHRLFAEYGDRVSVVPSGPVLRDIVGGLPAHDEDMIRVKLETLLADTTPG